MCYLQRDKHVCINTYRFHPYLVCGLACVPVSTRPHGNRFRLIDNLDPGHVDNIPDISRLSTNEKALAGGLAAESGRILNDAVMHLFLNSLTVWMIF